MFKLLLSKKKPELRAPVIGEVWLSTKDLKNKSENPWEVHVSKVKIIDVKSNHKGVTWVRYVFASQFEEGGFMTGELANAASIKYFLYCYTPPEKADV